VFLNLLRQRFTEGPLTWSDDDAAALHPETAE
jgi:hypothetical protein